MMTFWVSLKKTKKPTQSRMRFDLEKLRNRDAPGTFQTTIGEKFALLIDLRDDDRGIDSMITTYNTAVTDQPVRYLRRNVAEKALNYQRCPPSLIKGGIWRRGGMDKKERKNTEEQRGPEES